MYTVAIWATSFDRYFSLIDVNSLKANNVIYKWWSWLKTDISQTPSTPAMPSLYEKIISSRVLRARSKRDAISDVQTRWTDSEEFCNMATLWRKGSNFHFRSLVTITCTGKQWRRNLLAIYSTRFENHIAQRVFKISNEIRSFKTSDLIISLDSKLIFSDLNLLKRQWITLN